MDKRLRFMADLIEPLMVPPGTTVRLSRDYDPGYTGQVPRQQAAGLLADGVDLLAEYQDRLAAQDTYGVLLVLQGLDASGKDSTIKHVMSGVNPQGVGGPALILGEEIDAVGEQVEGLLTGASSRTSRPRPSTWPGGNPQSPGPRQLPSLRMCRPPSLASMGTCLAREDGEHDGSD